MIRAMPLSQLRALFTLCLGRLSLERAMLGLDSRTKEILEKAKHERRHCDPAYWSIVDYTAATKELRKIRTKDLEIRPNGGGELSLAVNTLWSHVVVGKTDDPSLLLQISQRSPTDELAKFVEALRIVLKQTWNPPFGEP